MFKTIINPNTNEELSIFSRKGRNLLKSYIKIYKLGGSNDELKNNLKMLIEMGYSEKIAKKALELSGDNLELAIDLILSGDLNQEEIEETKEEEKSLETDNKIDETDEKNETDETEDVVDDLPIITIEDFIERKLPDNVR